MFLVLYVCSIGLITSAEDVPKLAKTALATVSLEMTDRLGLKISYGSSFLLHFRRRDELSC